MTVAFRTVNAVYWLALTTWIAVIAAAAIAATGAFTTLPGLPLQVGEIPFTEAAEHGRYAAGRMMEPVFTVVDVIQLAVAPAALLALLLQLTILRQRWCAAANLVRAGCVIAAAGVLLYRVVMVMPPMNRDLQAYWTAAEAGTMVEATMHQQAFDRRHPVASDLYSATGVLLIVAVLASACAAPPPAPKRPDLEPPELLRRGGS